MKPPDHMTATNERTLSVTTAGPTREQVDAELSKVHTGDGIEVWWQTPSDRIFQLTPAQCWDHVTPLFPNSCWRALVLAEARRLGNGGRT